MKLEATLEIVNNLACKSGFRKNLPCSSQISVGKDQNKYYILVSSSKNPSGDKFRVNINIMDKNITYLL